MNILLADFGWSVWENLDLGRVYKRTCVRFVLTIVSSSVVIRVVTQRVSPTAEETILTTVVEILPYRPPDRLMRAK